MRLAGKLQQTTLGDLLGSLYRARAHGVLELSEAMGPSHRIHLREGRVFALETESGAMPLGALLKTLGLLDRRAERRLETRLARSQGQLIGQVLLDEGMITAEELERALEIQLRYRLDKLFAIDNARISFRAPRPHHPALRSAIPLAIEDYLHGRPRARDREADAPKSPPRRPSRPAERPQPPSRKASARSLALSKLGLSDKATVKEISRAFRRLAREMHPDAFPHISARERKRLEARFAELSQAYHRALAK